MKILLIDVDSKIPNLALGKLSTYFKTAFGAQVDFKKLGYPYYPKKKKTIFIDASRYAWAFVSIVFSDNKKYIKCKTKNISIGGPGFDYKIKLSGHVENQKIDYSLYPENKTSYGYLTKGCNRKCEFCIVPKMEGKIHRNNTLSDILNPGFKDLKLLDNNILIHPDHIELLCQLRDSNIRCQFKQGLDIRLVSIENAKILSMLNYEGEYTFAFDALKDEKRINRGLIILKKYISKDWRIRFFLYCNPEHSIPKDVLYRIHWCKKNKVLPFMIKNAP